MGLTGISCQPGLSQPVPGAVLTWEGSHFMRAGLSLGYGPWPAQVHSCALLFLRLVLGGGGVAWAEGSMAQSQCWH